MESVNQETLHTFECRVCKAPVSVGPRNRSCQFWIARCENCGVQVEERLAAITKKIIYLDQFVLSHILAAKDDRWQQIYKRLQWLNYLQIIVCPYSEIHKDESLAAEHSRDDLKELYRELSNGVRFTSIDSIEQTQLLRSIRQFLGCPNNHDDEKHYSKFCDKDPNRWELDSEVYADFPTNSHFVLRLQTRKDQLQEVLNSDAESWRQEDGRRFKDDVRREALEYGRSLISDYRAFDQDTQRLESMLPETLATVFRQCMGVGKFEPDKPPSTKPGALVVHWMACEVHKVRPDEPDPASAVEEFLSSDEAIKWTPFLMIASRLWAGIAQQSRNATGRRDPKASDKNDIALIAHYAPYCDAMVVDNHFRALATQGNVNVEKDHDVNLFSPKTLQQFSDYLDDLLQNISQSHRTAIKQVMPHLSMLPILKTD